MGKKLAVVGLYGMSALFRLDRLPMPGETAGSRALKFEQGGKGYNQALGALRMGTEVFFATAVGDDLYGKQAPAVFEQDGLKDYRCMVISDTPTAFASVLSDRTGANMVIVEQGASAKLTLDMADRLEDRIKDCDMLLLQCEMPDAIIKRLLETGKKHGLLTVLNPAPARCSVRELMPLCDLVTPNWGEAQTITGMYHASVPAVAEELVSYSHGAVVITLGKDGSYVQEPGHAGYFQKAVQVDSVDTTGAGDNFNGVLCARLLAGDSLHHAVSFANVSSGLSVTKYGVIEAIPTLKEVEEFMIQIKERDHKKN